MSVQRFFLMLLVVNAVVAIILLLLMQTHIGPYVAIGWLAMFAFSILSTFVFFMTDRIAPTKKKQLFIQIILVNMVAKFVFSGLIASMYYIKNKPESGVFILPFVVVYIVFTIFETYYMDKQARG